MSPWGLVQDGWSLPDSLFDIVRAGKGNEVPYLMVSDISELTGPSPVVADTLIADYPTILSGPAVWPPRRISHEGDQQCLRQH